MVTTERERTATLSRRAAKLQSYLRGHKSILRPGEGFSSTTATLFRKNDTALLLTPLEELATNAHMLPGGSVAATIFVSQEQISTMMQDLSDGMAEDKAAVFQSSMAQLVRIISYGIAAGSLDFVHENNIGIMNLLHKEVGLEAQVLHSALRQVRDFIVQQVTEPDLVQLTNDCFEVVVQKLV
ncbi:hypothetical protein BWQ96_08470 [Gracilariopsis chorda]|uniref:Uncharacterized protein n=1 Tax=Gracilariopsis chorda TaxID=448386 RepID=A0A2V3IIC7_9FLOR|nr:hypothetical protein BWQ96_08470 [Gracilariopsis chorda]|eukprot:PXF41822.1 hypothetical protein BWQ96_08470 [Gracilariopsis chorda]